MDSRKKSIQYTYTEEARKTLPEFNAALKEKLEKYVRDNKYVFGDDVIEITASDVRNAINDLRLSNRQFSQKSFKYEFIVTLYAIVGILLTVSGIYFESIQRIFDAEPQRGLLIFTGIITTVFAFSLSMFIKQRENQKVRSLEKKMDYEQNGDILSQLQAETLDLLRKIDALEGKPPRDII